MKQIVYIILLITLTTACKKKSMVVIQAQNLTNLADGSDYAGMEYVVVESWTPVLEVKTKRIATGVLDANGHAAFEIKMKNNRKYNLSIAQPDNICYGGVGISNQALASLNHEKNNTINFEYATCGDFNLRYENINCSGNNDKFQITYYTTINTDIYTYRGYITGENNDWSDVFFIEGCQSYLGDFSDRIPAGNYTIEWRVIRPSGTTTGIDYFTVTENDTTTYILEY